MTELPSFDSIQIEITDHVGWLRFNRPPVNAFSWEMLAETRAAYDALEAHPDVRIIVFGTAIETHMSAGADM